MGARIISSVMGIIVLGTGYYYSAFCPADEAHYFQWLLLIAYAFFGVVFVVYKYLEWLWRGK